MLTPKVVPIAVAEAREVWRRPHDVAEENRDRAVPSHCGGARRSPTQPRTPAQTCHPITGAKRPIDLGRRAWEGKRPGTGPRHKQPLRHRQTCAGPDDGGCRRQLTGVESPTWGHLPR